VHRNALVTIRHATIPLCEQGAVRIQRLIPVERARADINLFETIPVGWCKDRDLVKRAISLWEALPRALAHLVTSVFWDSDRFHRFVMGPSSLDGHHDQWNGNFRHAIEVADHAREIGGRSRLANVALLIAGGLLHDAAKADEYRLSRDGKHFRLSERGQLVGHRDTLIEWLAVAREVGRVVLADEVYLSLLHTINASKAPPWVGLRDPRCIEPEILSMADKLSGHHDLHERCAPTDAASGFGQFHKHLSHRTYVTPRISV
jgi:3'-5' exoribonuclease